MMCCAQTGGAERGMAFSIDGKDARGGEASGEIMGAIMPQVVSPKGARASVMAKA